MPLNEDNKDLGVRYARQIAVEAIGKSGQQKIREAAVLIIGCGALGSMVAMQLAGAGIGKIGICDFDTIDISNLQRQFFFKETEAGQKKVETLYSRIKELNSEVKIESFSKLITEKDCYGLFESYDFIVDATDNPESKKMTGKVSGITKKTCCIGGVRDFGGQIMTLMPDDRRFEDYFGIVSDGGFMPCSIGGVAGPAAAFCASVQTAETIKYLTGTGKLLTGKLLIFDLLKNYFKVFEV